MMKVKLSKLLEMKPVITKLIQQDVSVTVGYDLMKLVRAFESELELYGKARTKLFDKYGKEDKEKQTKVIEDDKKEIFQKSIIELLNKEVKIEVKKIKVSNLSDIKLSTLDLLKIDILIER